MGSVLTVLLMYQPLVTTAFLHIAYRPDSCLLVGRWQCSINEAQLRQGYELLRHTALEHNCGHWLIDARRRIDRRRNGPEWVVTNFLPQVQAELGQPLCVAFLVLPNHLRELESESDLPIRTTNPAVPLQYARFIEEGAANAWLEAQRVAIRQQVAH
ncbi:hypothetical protein GCM10027594_33380 [Hymenobacter agri]